MGPKTAYCRVLSLCLIVGAAGLSSVSSAHAADLSAAVDVDLGSHLTAGIWPSLPKLKNRAEVFVAGFHMLDWRTHPLPSVAWFSGFRTTNILRGLDTQPARSWTTAEAAMMGADDPRFLTFHADSYGAIGFDGSPLTRLDEDWSMHVFTGHDTPHGFGFGNPSLRFQRGYSMGFFFSYGFN